MITNDKFNTLLQETYDVEVVRHRDDPDPALILVLAEQVADGRHSAILVRLVDQDGYGDPDVPPAKVFHLVGHAAAQMDSSRIICAFYTGYIRYEGQTVFAVVGRTPDGREQAISAVEWRTDMGHQYAPTRWEKVPFNLPLHHVYEGVDCHLGLADHRN